MRRTMLLSFFVLAACGGGVRSTTDSVNPSVDLMAQRQAFLLTADAHAVLAEFAKSYNQDAIDTCSNAWVEIAGGPNQPTALIYKPDVGGFRTFMSACLSGKLPGNVRAAPAGDVRAASAGDLRGVSAGDARSVRAIELRAAPVDSLRTSSAW